MICQRCLHRASTRALLPKNSIFPNQRKPLTSHPTPHLLTRTLTTTTHSNIPLPTTSTAQFATPLTPTLPPTASAPTASSASKTIPTSSVPAGTPLRGLNYLKTGSEPLALEGDAYPAWLWRCLDTAGTKKGGADGADGGGGAEGLEGDLFCSFCPPRLPFLLDFLHMKLPHGRVWRLADMFMWDAIAKSKKQRRIAAKKLRKLAAANPESLVRKVPVQEQSVDLWAGDGTVQGAVRAEAGRREVTRALRGVRRRGIKEGNFLRGMR